VTTTPIPARPNPLERITDAIWVGVPLTLRRFSAGLTASTVDGLYLAVRPLVGFIAPMATFIFGFLTGAIQPGYTYVFTEAIWLLLLIAVVGAISGAVGFYLTIGFIIGDLLIGDHPQWYYWFGGLNPLDIPAQYGSMLLSYALFAMLAVGVPIAAKSFAAEFRLPDSVPRGCERWLA
jgi:hypothetical protein